MLDYRLYLRNDQMNFISKENHRLKFLFNRLQFSQFSRNRNHFFKLKRNSLKKQNRYNACRYKDRDYDRLHIKNEKRDYDEFYTKNDNRNDCVHDRLYTKNDD